MWGWGSRSRAGRAGERIERSSLAGRAAPSYDAVARVSAPLETDRALDRWAALGVVALAGLMRALPFATVFHAGQVVFAPADAMYHVRRSFYTFDQWPSVLLFDHYVNHPGGAPIPWSPLPDILAGSLAALIARDEYAFEAVLAWWPVLIGALGALPIYFVARTIASRGVALGAGAIYALLPVSVAYGRVGNPDHHVATAAGGACLLLLCVQLAARERDRRSLVWLAALLALTRAALLLTWHGSLLYLAVLESTLLGLALLGRRPEVHAVHALSALGTLLLVGPILATFPTPLLGLYSSIALSRLHLIAVAGAGLVALACWGYDARAPHRAGTASRLGVAAAAGLLFLAIVLSLPGPREGLTPALRFLTMTDAAGATTAEQFSLFSPFGRTADHAVTGTWGLYAYLLPLCPVFLLLWARRHAPAPTLVVAFWAAAFGFLALGQLRYGNDAAAAACVGFAVAGGQLHAWLRHTLRLPRAVAVVVVVGLGLALYATPIRTFYAPWAVRSAAKLTGIGGEDRWPLATAGWPVHQFLEAVRAVTPETSGYTDPAARPEYGVVAPANLGHAVQWVARRPTPTDPFWEYIGPENWQRSSDLLMSENEAEAIRLSRALRARYVIVAAGRSRGRLQDRLFRDDGLRRPGQPAYRRFRLVTEGPRGAGALETAVGLVGGAAFEAGAVPYKLFEVVEGARLEIPAAPGSRVEASLVVRTPAGREFRYQTAARTPSDGLALLRVPYANEPAGARSGEHAVTPAPRWEITIDGRAAGTLYVPEAAVVAGDVVRFP